MQRFEDVALPGLEDIPDSCTSSPRPVRRANVRTLAPTEAARAAFWRRVVKAPGNGCWILVAAISSPDGYTRIGWRDGGRERTVSGHRFALELAYGPLPPSVIAEHKCNEPLCVRVSDDHVVPSTQKENLRYAVECGRSTFDASGFGAADRVARSRAVRDAVSGGWDQDAYDAANILVRSDLSLEQGVLFDV